MTEIKYASADEETYLARLTRIAKWFPADSSLENLGLFLTSKNLARLLFLDHIYQKIVNVPGVVMDFGTRWGQNAVVFSNLRSIYEPFHRHRKVVAFDTFKGFPGITTEDGKSELMTEGNLALPFGYDDTLRGLLKAHEALNPMPRITKYEVVAGDVCGTLPAYLVRNPETIVALAYFDMDLYRPTLEALKLLRARLTRGSVIAFDELNDHDSPGETLALMEAYGTQYSGLRRVPWCSRTSYFVV